MADGRCGLRFSSFLVELFLACLFCHSAATELRPQRASEATLFYLLFAAGGALGSFLIGIAAPSVFTFNLDLPITFLITALLALAVNWSGVGVSVCCGLSPARQCSFSSFWVDHAYKHDTIVAVRNFYASLRVTRNPSSYAGATVLTLANGSIRHGTQILGSNELRHTPTTYYTSDSGVGLAVRFCCGGRARNIGVIGLGAGTLAAYGRPGDHIRFYEINPAVPAIAQNTFTYIRDSAAQVEIVEGDARTSLARESPQHFDVLVVDAFSGDAIPIHLLTTEALALYRRHLTQHGILAFHISNRARRPCARHCLARRLCRHAGAPCLHRLHAPTRRILLHLDACNRRPRFLRTAGTIRSRPPARIQAGPESLDRRLLRPAPTHPLVKAILNESFTGVLTTAP